MKFYELTYLISSELSEEETKLLLEKIGTSIKEEGGILIGENTILKKKLAYPVRQPTIHTWHTQAYLAFLNFQLNPEGLTNLEKKLKAETKILRYLLLTKKEPKVIRGIVRVAPFIKKPKEVVEKEKKVELKEIEKKLEEILKE